MIKRWDALLAGTPRLNQPVFNDAVREIDGLRHVGLPDTLFPTGRHYFEVMNETARRGVAVVHNNFIIGHDTKKKRFEEHNLWI
jgi:hypothetical protein